jgi:hypothetical protein
MPEETIKPPESGDTPPAVKTKRVKLGDEELELDEPLAQKLESYEAATVQRLQQIQSEYEAKLAALIPKGPDTEKPPSKRRLDTDRILADTEGFVADLIAEMEDKIATAKQEAQTQIANERQVLRFWDDFWRDNPDLDRNEDAFLAEAIASQHANEWSKLTVSAASKKLADATRKKIESMLDKRKNRSTNNDEPVISGGGGFTRTVKKTEEKPEKPKTLSDIMRERQKARMGR